VAALARAVREHRLEVDRDADDEPHVARAEEEHARKAQARGVFITPGIQNYGRELRKLSDSLGDPVPPAAETFRGDWRICINPDCVTRIKDR
jgi:hypothetical protein